MRERLRQVERLARLRASQERMRQAELAREQARLLLSEQQVAAAAGEVEAERQRAHDLLLAGDGAGSWQAQSGLSLGLAWLAHCQRQAASRVVQVQAAQERHRQSRLQLEQSDRLVEKMTATLATEEQRKVQGQSDERFAARAHWTSTRAQLIANSRKL